jgi:aryl-alcohol dehydrogenase-like predicted oxidoreductase
LIETSDFRTARIPLAHGAGQIPVLGFGTLIPDAAATIGATGDALEAGFRHFDCAERYRNEREVGEALTRGMAAGGIARKDVFVTTKPSCGTPIIGPSASNRLSMPVWQGSGSTIWTSISFTLHLRFNRETTRTRAIKTETSFTTAV